jgi:peptidoglycan/xylan/chitin deacetylase (PgdA/CDA1 family)
MIHRILPLRAALALSAALCATPAAADRAALQAACWPARALAAVPGERTVRRGVALPLRVPPAAGPPRTPSGLVGAIRRVELPPGRKLIALTLDLCEQPGEVAGYDGAIFDYLRAARVKATVFAGGRWMASHPERTAQLAADPLFELAGHGWAHRNVRLLSGAALAEEIAGPGRAYAAARAGLAERACVRPHAAALAGVPATLGLFRFPFGACNRAALEAVAAQGLVAIQWDVSTGDPSPAQSAQAIAAQITRNVRPGSIVIAHANGRGRNTAAALPIAIPRLRAMGYELVTVGELLAAGRPVVAETCYDARPGDTDRYDAFFRRPAGQSAEVPRDVRPPPAVPR